MNYLLMHKNIPSLSFQIDEDGLVTNINQVFNESHVPIFILKNQFISPDNALKEWWSSRAIPASRENLSETLLYLNIKNSQSLMIKNYALNLSDHYWVATEKDIEKGLMWEDINFFQNDFSKDIGNALFGNFSKYKAETISFNSPDSSSDGELKKKWTINNGIRYLLKGGRKTFQQEPFNEVLVSKICDELNVNHVPYKILKKKNMQFYSSCPCMIDENTELISAWELFVTSKKSNNMSYLDQLINGMKKNNLDFDSKMKQDFSKMFTVDYLVANTDRHLKNFAFIRNPNTLEWQGLAPIYDTGNSMFYDESVYSLKEPRNHESKAIKAKPFNSNQEKQLSLIIKKCGSPNIDFNILKNLNIGNWFVKLLEQNPLIDSERSNILGNILNNRIFETEKVIREMTISKNEEC